MAENVIQKVALRLDSPPPRIPAKTQRHRLSIDLHKPRPPSPTFTGKTSGMAPSLYKLCTVLESP
ncbi:hypothetical protein GSI_11460 [Ganoderma sinense ZZ0214-1]|uniref:Uncharacterized protein n=1 Tax=Ganoderma sinense ZZ0214-1 TaxID=1077348 RepID=A0A2G8RW22_9APHY|nr:hypothetical protein GSI_11460 [Ganoderma sinense ZZ0214-1]